MSKENGMDLVPEPLGWTPTITLPTGMGGWAEEELEPYDPKRHNVKIVVAKPLKIQEDAQ